MSKDTFKAFARVHPELATSVLNGNATWQQLYELYEIYGENNSIWNNYFTETTISNKITSSANTFKEFVNTFKNLDMESLQKNITNIQKTIAMIQEIGLTKDSKPKEVQPIYKRFED